MKRNASNDASRPSGDEAIEATAAAWLAQRDDAMAPADETEFARWRAADSRHEAAVTRLEGAWANLQRLRDFRPEAVQHPDRDLLTPRTMGKKLAFPVRSLALAAAAVFVVAAGWWTFQRAGAVRSPAAYATTAGGYQRVMLADGSVLELNGDTSAEVRFTATERRVRLARGEAYFTVAKNPARPFWVEAGGVAVRAVGTAFNVRLGTGDVEVLVTEGRVQVDRVVGPAPAAVPTRNEPDSRAGAPASGGPTLLEINERALIPLARPAAAPPPAPVVERLTLEIVRDALAWQGPRLVFVDTPLAEVAAQFNRRNAVQLVLADAALGTLSIGGSFRAENVEGFVRLLESGGDVVVERPDASSIVLRRAK